MTTTGRPVIICMCLIELFSLSGKTLLESYETYPSSLSFDFNTNSNGFF